MLYFLNSGIIEEKEIKNKGLNQLTKTEAAD